MRIHIASDHAGFVLKEYLKTHLIAEGHECLDYGAHELNREDDYPDIVGACMVGLQNDLDASAAAMGVVLGGSGQGEAIVANKYNRIRATVYYGGSIDILRLSREHNDANVLSLGARFLKESEALDAVRIWLRTPFSRDARHVRRIKKISLHQSRA
ncbi:MAG: RpiB/LacA/LacB family sugar-phosphate isomerase [Patescibacteria group bacterium]|mgnify:CR=1 FL=1